MTRGWLVEIIIKLCLDLIHVRSDLAHVKVDLIQTLDLSMQSSIFIVSQESAISSLEPVEAPYPVCQEEEMRIYEQNRKWFTDAQAQGVNIWYNETFGGDDVCEIKIVKVKITIIVFSWVYPIKCFHYSQRWQQRQC